MDVKVHAHEAQEASYKIDKTYGIPFRFWMCDIQDVHPLIYDTILFGRLVIQGMYIFNLWWYQCLRLVFWTSEKWNRIYNRVQYCPAMTESVTQYGYRVYDIRICIRMIWQLSGATMLRLQYFKIPRWTGGMATILNQCITFIPGHNICSSKLFQKQIFNKNPIMWCVRCMQLWWRKTTIVSSFDFSFCLKDGQRLKIEIVSKNF